MSRKKHDGKLGDPDIEFLSCSRIVAVQLPQGELYHGPVYPQARTQVDVQAACDAVIRLTGSIQPDDENTHAYAVLYPNFKEFYPALRPSFHQLGGL